METTNKTENDYDSIPFRAARIIYDNPKLIKILENIPQIDIKCRDYSK